MYTNLLRRTCLVVAVAWARKKKLATEKEVDRYELNVLLRDEPSSRVRKYGVAVISAGSNNVRFGLSGG